MTLKENPRAWLYSLSVHLFLGVGAFLSVSIGACGSETIEFEVYEYPEVQSTPTVELPQPTPRPKPKAEGKAVYGLNSKALESSDADAIAVKKGNTLAKEQDDAVLEDGDPESLPIPAEEYLVSQMPELLSEVRVPYPVEAREAGIEGEVVLDVLIDDKGIVRDAKLVEGPGFGLNEAALKAILSFRFRPAKVEEKTVAVRIRYVYRFLLQ